jgi:hypothetical protein
MEIQGENLIWTVRAFVYEHFVTTSASRPILRFDSSPFQVYPL